MLTYIKRLFSILFGGETCKSNCSGNCNQGRTCNCEEIK